MLCGRQLLVTKHFPSMHCTVGPVHIHCLRFLIFGGHGTWSFYKGWYCWILLLVHLFSTYTCSVTNSIMKTKEALQLLPHDSTVHTGSEECWLLGSQFQNKSGDVQATPILFPPSDNNPSLICILSFRVLLSSLPTILTVVIFRLPLFHLTVVGPVIRQGIPFPVKLSQS